MGGALPGMHYCKDHQGNHAHYADHNCVVCKVVTLLNNHKHRMEQDVRPDDKHMHEVNSLRGFHLAVKMLMDNPPRTQEPEKEECQS